MHASRLVRIDSRPQLERTLRTSLLLPNDSIPLLQLGHGLLEGMPGRGAGPAEVRTTCAAPDGDEEGDARARGK